MDKGWDGTKHGKKECDFSKVNHQAGCTVESVLALLGQRFCHLTMRRLCASVCPEIMSFLEHSQYFPESLESALCSLGALINNNLNVNNNIKVEACHWRWDTLSNRVLNQCLPSSEMYNLSHKVWGTSIFFSGPDNCSLMLCRRQTDLSRIRSSICSNTSCL